MCASSFDHLIGAGEQDRRDVNAERARGFEIDYQFERRWLLYWQFSGFFAFEDTASIDTGQAVGIGNT
jgi:hypothetical protein